MLSITKTFTFEAAHRISNYQGACSQLHGHSYQLEVSIGAEEPGEDDMVMDFKLLKSLVKESIVNPLDHCLLLKENDQNKVLADSLDSPVFWMDDEPTAERLVLWVKSTLSPLLPSHVFLLRIKLYETATGFVEWYME